jgi:hypothetical protein
MNRKQRKAHVLVWPLLLALMAAVWAAAFVAKANTDAITAQPNAQK